MESITEILNRIAALIAADGIGEHSVRIIITDQCMRSAEIVIDHRSYSSEPDERLLAQATPNE